MGDPALGDEDTYALSMYCLVHCASLDGMIIGCSSCHWAEAGTPECKRGLENSQAGAEKSRVFDGSTVLVESSVLHQPATDYVGAIVRDTV